MTQNESEQLFWKNSKAVANFCWPLQSPLRWHRPPQHLRVRHACYRWRQVGLLKWPATCPYRFA